MKPGETTRPPASILSSPPWFTLPISTIVPSLIPTSPKNHGLPVPSTTRPFSSTRSSTAAAYRTFPRAATRVSSTLPSSPTMYTSSCRFTVLQMWLGIICNVSPTSRSQSSSTESIPCSSVSLSRTASGWPTTSPNPTRFRGAPPGCTSVAKVLLPPSITARSLVGLLTTVATTSTAQFSREHV